MKPFSVENADFKNLSVNGKAAAIKEETAGWKGDLDVYSNYTKGDIVKYAGKTYIASDNINSDPAVGHYPTDPGSNWDELGGGASSGGWKGNLDVYANYNSGDIVEHSGKTYIASDSINSDPVMGHYPTDPGSNWRELGGGASSGTWKRDWDVNQNYTPGEIVRYQEDQCPFQTRSIYEMSSHFNNNC